MSLRLLCRDSLNESSRLSTSYSFGNFSNVLKMSIPILSATTNLMLAGSFITSILDFGKSAKRCHKRLLVIGITLWRHQMATFSALLGLCEGNSPVTGELPSQRLVTRRFDVFFDLRLNKQSSKQSWGWWFETPLCPLWRRYNDQKGNDWLICFPCCLMTYHFCTVVLT